MATHSRRKMSELGRFRQCQISFIFKCVCWHDCYRYALRLWRWYWICINSKHRGIFSKYSISNELLSPKTSSTYLLRFCFWEREKRKENIVHSLGLTNNTHFALCHQSYVGCERPSIDWIRTCRISTYRRSVNLSEIAHCSSLAWNVRPHSLSEIVGVESTWMKCCLSFPAHSFQRNYKLRSCSLRCD